MPLPVQRYFQHTPYLDSFNAEKGTHLVNVGEIHYEPLGIYGGTESDLANISDGATIAVPNDTTNEARALLLLQDNGIITLKDGAGMEEKIILDTNANNKRAQHVYEELGFTKLRVRENSWKNQLGELQSVIDYEMYQVGYKFRLSCGIR